jgi:peptidoglycan/LPS O-acetylase OafA/YrhL
MLYIVGFWHMMEYAPAVVWSSNYWTEEVTILSLALFVLISGYLIGKKKLGVMDIWPFYRSRFFRIYLPLLATAIIFSFGNVSHKAILKAVTLVAMFVEPAPKTLWFVSMILVFYLISPLLIRLRERMVLYFMVCAATLGGMLLYEGITGMADTRIILYFPCFAAGVFLATQPLPSSFGALVGLSVLAVGAASLSLGRPIEQLESDLHSMPWALAGSVATFMLFKHFGGAIRVPSLAVRLSEASFFMYLLHRPIYGITTRIWMPSSPKLQIGYLVIICLPILGIGAWFLQSLYTRLFDKWSS